VFIRNSFTVSHAVAIPEPLRPVWIFQCSGSPVDLITFGFHIIGTAHRLVCLAVHVFRHSVQFSLGHDCRPGVLVDPWAIAYSTVQGCLGIALHGGGVGALVFLLVQDAGSVKTLEVGETNSLPDQLLRLVDRWYKYTDE